MNTPTVLTSKQTRYIRSQAMTMKPLVQVGKNGLTDEVVESLTGILDEREIVKVQVLNNAPSDTVEIADALAGRGFTVAQRIGHTIVIYRQSDKPENRRHSAVVNSLTNVNKGR